MLLCMQVRVLFLQFFPLHIKYWGKLRNTNFYKKNEQQNYKKWEKKEERTFIQLPEAPKIDVIIIQYKKWR